MAARGRWALIAAALLLICLATPAPLAARSTVAARLPLSIETQIGSRHYRVELAESPEAQMRGLMFRTSLPRDGGMIFPFPRPQRATFWMKNTLIPLDLIFIRADGTIARIAANATPLSLDLIDAGEPVTAVLEIRGGGAVEDGIAPGDVVRWRGAGRRTP